MKIYKDYLNYKTSENKIYNFVRTLLYPSFIAIVLFRFADGIYHLNKKIFYFPAKIIMLIPRILFGIDISIGAEIGEGLTIGHGCGIVIGTNAIIGKNVSIAQQVTIGGNYGKTRRYKKYGGGRNRTIYADDRR
ncbi:MAG: serine O-acetyltransferase [Fusobacterium sp.]